MTDTTTSQNIDLSSWDILYITQPETKKKLPTESKLHILFYTA
jgi:hypothetical protein